MNRVLLRRDLAGKPAEPWSQDLDLLNRHNFYFETRLADTPALLQTAHQIRYQVYCLERGFENAGEHGGGLETDAYDGRAMAGLLVHRPTGDAIGTVRLVRPDFNAPGVFPVGELLAEQGINLGDYVDLSRTLEVSRFAISKSFRRRRTDDMEFTGSPEEQRSERIRQGNLPCLSLLQFIMRQSRMTGARYWVAAMEVKLLRMLHSMGLHYTPLGPEVMHHGLRQPCYREISSLERELWQEQPDYWRVCTDNGALVPMPEMPAA
jgi:N-acyl amino acid synthase of PEP-CTERM/exosortase system